MPTPTNYEDCLDELRATRNLCSDLFTFIYDTALSSDLESPEFEDLRERMLELEFF